MIRKSFPEVSEWGLKTLPTHLDFRSTAESYLGAKQHKKNPNQITRARKQNLFGTAEHLPDVL